MLSRVELTIRERGLFDRGDRVLCAVSGGPDSMALLHALWELRQRLGLELAVATVDHGLRPEARAEAELVAARARDLDVEWRLLAVDVRAARASSPRSSSWQDVARRLRLEALEAHARAVGAQKIALGHQSDDQEETILFRILRGTGVRGLAGIPYRRGMLVRPLLDLGRAQILTYLRRRSIPFVEDPSNRDPRFARARLRHQILPALRAENPRLGEALRALGTDAARLTGGPAAQEATQDGPPLNRRAAAVVERLRRARGGTRRVDVAGAEVQISYGQVTWRPGRAAVPGRAAAALAMIDPRVPGDYGRMAWRRPASRDPRGPAGRGRRQL